MMLADLRRRWCQRNIGSPITPKEELMSDLTRRTVLAGATVAGAAAMSPIGTATPANAAAPPSGQQAPGYYRYKIADYEITVVTDGATTRPLADGFVINQKKEDVNAALARAYLEKDKLTIPYSPIVVNTGSKLVVIDTGTSEANFEASKGAAGQFHGNLKAAGIDRNAVDVVVISHFHGDHINGLLTPDQKPSFGSAEIMVPAAEWKYFMDDGEMSRAPAGRMQDVFKNTRRVFDALGRKVTPYEAGKEIVPGITSVATWGHTPGHSSHIVSSGSSAVYVQADVTNIPALFVRNPGWHATFDQDAKMAEETRRKVYDMLAAEKLAVQGFHYPFPALAYIEKTATGYREIPVPWNPKI
jgi:glyoxylase-like metal-dependent hydrolase (beta-lactamase superfamily II)